jgi:type I restriction enzyme M protein
LKFGQLTLDEVKALVVDDKWLADLHARTDDALARVSQSLTGRVQQLAVRYLTPLPLLAKDIELLARRVDAHFVAMGHTWD